MSTAGPGLVASEPGAGVRSTSHPRAHCRAAGDFACELTEPPGASLWVAAATLGAGASLEWTRPHGDEAVYVVTGAVEVDGRECPTRGAVVLEADAETRLLATDDTRVVHFGEVAPSPARERSGPPQVHVVGPGGTWADVTDGRDTRFFADATCPTCSPWLLYTARHFEFDSAPHAHSQDELIYLLWGEIVLGKRRLQPGSTLYIRADQFYRFRSGKQGFGFLNYRAGPSTMTFQTDGRTLTENGASTGLTPIDDLR